MTNDLTTLMLQIGKNAKAASAKIGTLDSDAKKSCLHSMADCLEQATDQILLANNDDICFAKEKNISGSFLDRLSLNENRVNEIAVGIRMIADLADPVGKIISTTIRPNGLKIEKVVTPIGVIGVIYESRPNVTADAAALCFKSGNAVILRGGSAAHQTNRTIHQAMCQGLASSGLDPHMVQWIETVDRNAVGEMLAGLNGCIDVIVPRGGKSLVARVQSEARVPVFSHLEGICHTYVHKDADPEMAISVTLNAKLRRTGICGATETLLVDKEYPEQDFLELLTKLHDSNCKIIGDDDVAKIYSGATRALDTDWSTEYLAPTISVRLLNNVDEAIDHISQFGSSHTESIITENQSVANVFLQKVDSAIVMHNASTQFADGGEFGMGAEIGIATGKMHARGPVGIEQLTTFKYLVRGTGQVRA